ncbi:MAG: hypothetical protein LBK70_03270 [Clostridiales bacterium]|nr:hypothetical protein [Clostridiales bacterium]
MTLLTKIQTASIESMQDFENACEELAVAKYILADAKISKLLQCIVANSDLYTLVGKVCNGFDPIAVLNSHCGKNSLGCNTVLPPQDLALCVGFVFRILFLLDTERTKQGGERILIDFLSKYYNAQDLNESMIEFGVLVRAFKQGVLQLLQLFNK